MTLVADIGSAESIQEAEAAEAAAYERVSFVRGELALGRATRGDLNRAQRTLAIATEATETAKAAARAVGRDRAAAAAAEQAERDAVRRARAAQLAPERDAIARDTIALMRRTLDELGEIDRRIATWQGDAPTAGLSGVTLERVGAALARGPVVAISEFIRQFDPARR
jgi:hypothetical protein